MSEAPRRAAIERGCGIAEIDCLSHDPVIRAHAVRALAFDRESFVRLAPALRRALTDTHGPVRQAATERAGRLGRLARWARNRDAVAAHLSELTQWLLEALDDPLPSVREAACGGLAAVADQRAAPVSHELGAGLARCIESDPTWWVRRAAVRALAGIWGEAAIPVLIRGLEDPFWRVRHAVVQALALVVERAPLEVGGDPGEDREQLRERERARLREVVLDAGAELGDAARAALAYLASGWPEGEDQIPEQLGIIRDPGAGLELADPDPAVVTARLLAASPGSLAAAELIPLLAESHGALRAEARRRLAGFDDAQTLRPAMAWLEDPRVPAAPAEVARLLGRLGARARPLAELGLNSGLPGALAWAIEWAANHGADDLLDRALAQSAHPRLRVRAALFAACGRVLWREQGRAPTMERVLIAGMSSPSMALRSLAAEGLARCRKLGAHLDLPSLGGLAPRTRALCMGDPSVALECLQAGLGDVDGRVRAAALRALGVRSEFGSRAELSERALADGDPEVQAAGCGFAPTARVAEMTLDDSLDHHLRRVCGAELLRRARLDGPAGLAELEGSRADLAAALVDTPDPRLRVIGIGLYRPKDLDRPWLLRLLAATRDRSPAVRGEAADRLDPIDDLERRLEALLAGELSPDEQIACWSALLLGPANLPRGRAYARLQRALEQDLGAQRDGDDDDGVVRAHLEALTVALAPEIPTWASPAAPHISSSAGTRPSAARPSITTRTLGRSGLEVAPLVISGANELSPSSLAFAVEHGVDTLFWEPRYINMTRFLRQPRRRALQVIAGSFHADRAGLERDLQSARRRLNRECIDLFMVFWVRSPARLGAETSAALREFQARGWIRSYGFSTHARALACEAMATGDWPVVMTRHSAAHTGAERELFPTAVARDVGLLSFSALCYGRMLQPSSVLPQGPTAADCYRYSLAQEGVGACISAPRRHAELAHNLELLSAPEFSEPTRPEVLLAHGREVYGENKRFDRLVRRGGTAPLREAVLALFERARLETAETEDQAAETEAQIQPRSSPSFS